MKKRSNTYESGWDTIADTPEQSANLRARAELMRQIAEIIEAEGSVTTAIVVGIEIPVALRVARGTRRPRGDG